MRTAALALLVVGCASAPPPEPEVAPAPVAAGQPCELEGAPLRVPVAEGWALASSPEGCLLVDETRDGVALTLAALPHDLEGVDALGPDPRGFFRESGLLGAAPRFTGREPVSLLGGSAEGQAFVAELEGLGERAGLAVARRVGPRWMVAIFFHAPGDDEAHGALVRALEATTPDSGG
ncbi:MAG: hypothetical protein CMN30_29630 [Sandaracinus sp.]|mgnify:CR=1 FL=1|nr:hypothetical protein [Sandaracinus sp.]